FLLLPWRSLSDCYFFSLPQLARLCSKLVCYFSNCLQYREGAACFLPEDVDPSPCTHLIRAFAGMDSHQLSSIEWNEETLYKEFHGLPKMNPKLKTLLAFGGWSFGTQNPSSDKQHFTALVQQEAQTSRKACLLLSSVTPAGRHDEEAGHEVDKIALSLRQMARTMNLDSHRLMAHDLHGSWEKAPGHDSSLRKRRGECRVMDRLKVLKKPNGRQKQDTKQNAEKTGFVCFLLVGLLYFPFACMVNWQKSSWKRLHDPYLIMDMYSGESKVKCCKYQYCIQTWNVRSMNQGKLDVVKQEQEG
ncbi:hypothetical protein FD755_011215, partial [Muntiacus reevesi]